MTGHSGARDRARKFEQTVTATRSRRIKIAYLPLSLEPGGAERQMLVLAERLPRDRFQVELLVVSPTGPYAERASRAGIGVRSAGPTTLSGDPAPERFRARAATLLGLVKIARAGRYDVIDAWLYPLDVLMALTSPLIHRPIVISGRRNVERPERFGRFEGLVGSTSRRFTDIVVANSEAAARHAIATQGVDPAILRIIRNGVEIPGPIPTHERAARRRALGAADDEIIIGCVARYSSLKRLDLMLDAFSQVPADGARVRLELIGDGPLRAQLEAQVRVLGLADRVCLHGFEAMPERLYPAFDIVALASDREGLPNVLLEAGAAGCAIVSTAAGGAPEIVIDGRTGLLVPVNDADALTTALARLVGNPALRASLGAAARRHVATAFGMDRFVAEFATLYEDAVEHKRRKGASRLIGG